jgi:hypothetical protein
MDLEASLTTSQISLFLQVVLEWVIWEEPQWGVDWSLVV